jgi:hypothetical protein
VRVHAIKHPSSILADCFSIAVERELLTRFYAMPAASLIVTEYTERHTPHDTRCPITPSALLSRFVHRVNRWRFWRGRS